MSEYQYYEFQALDRPLSASDHTFLQGLSGRVALTATSATFTYSYGDLRGRSIEVLDRCFDLMLYIANFGVRQLMIRLPKQLADPARFEPYCLPHCIEVTETAKSVILNIHLVSEDYYTWVDDNSKLSQFVSVRKSLLQGDLRPLYLAWLKAGLSEDLSADPEELIEPLVPANLGKLSPSLKAFTDFFAIDSDLIAAAAEASLTQGTPEEPIETWIAALPEAERNAYLVRVAQGESHVGAELMLRLRTLFGQSDTSPGVSAGRSLADLLARAEQKQAIREREEQEKAHQVRQAQLEKLAPKADRLWKEVFRLVELKQSKPYDEAVAHLKDLRDLAEYQGNLESFRDRIRQIKQQYSNRPGFLKRLQEVALLRP